MLKFKEKFGIKVVSPTDMLGLERHVYVKDGVRYCHLSQKAYVDRLWREFGHHRRTTRVPERPCGDILFTTKETGKAVEVDKEESDAVIQKGYREAAPPEVCTYLPRHGWAGGNPAYAGTLVREVGARKPSPVR